MTQHLVLTRTGGRVASPDSDPDATFATIQRILTHEWDPLGISGGPSQGEYDWDASTLCQMMEDGVPPAELEAYLARREAEMGVGVATRRSRHDVVASLVGMRGG